MPGFRSAYQRWRLHLLLAFILLGSSCRSASAFMTFWWFGGAIHKAIIWDALRPLGVRDSSLRVISRGTDSQDNPFRSRIGKSERHAVNNQIGGAYEYFMGCTEAAALKASDAYKSPRSLEQSLFILGRGMHTLQDFCSHSNYLEWLLANHLPLQPVDWQNVPPAVRTCYYHFNSPIDQEPFHSHAVNVRKLKAKHPGTNFRSEDDYRRRRSERSYEAALRYALEPGDLMHVELNKDNRAQLEGRVMAPEYGKTLHELARRLAVLDSARQWQKFEAIIDDRFKDRSALILPAVKGAPLPDIAVTIDPTIVSRSDAVAKGRLTVSLKNTDQPLDIGIRATLIETGQEARCIIRKGRFTERDLSLYLQLDHELPLALPQKHRFRVQISTYFACDPQFPRGRATIVFIPDL